MKKASLLFLFFGLLQLGSLVAQKKTAEPKKDTLSNDIYNGLKFRNIGPAFMSGRIADVVIHPKNNNTWYVAVGSGGVWKTENAGTTWKPVFDGQNVYSIGCITLDPSNANTVWVGTGENVGGRHVGFGDGVYVSYDGGSSWKNMGLKNSEHISKIVVHPTNSNIIWVAAQGPLWSKGGERGLYKSTDGGKTWKKTLGDDVWVGATDICLDSRDANTLYAATWQRQRTVAGYMGGGPGSAIYKSVNGGDTWEKLAGGLPTGNLGKIGLAISPQKPDVVYAAIELDRRKGGVFRSENKGASWNKMSDAVAGATGPHYYQELYACPHQFDRIYLVDNVMQISDNGGKSFVRMNENSKHVDNHAIAFKANDPDYLLVGTDGGLYETFDRTTTWKYIGNLPVTQFYKIALDDALPFYNIIGGTQDNSTQAGPSRTDNANGISNADWSVVLFADGHQPATEPGNPNIVYAEWQQGNLVRHDRTTGENVYIQPQPEPGEKAERFNWDSPILVSPHNPKHIYYASQRVWKSTDRGDSWTPISGDLTKNIERMKTPYFDQLQGWDNPWDLYAMSYYSTITSLAESPLKEGLIYAGTDDGNMQVTEDGGKNWRIIPYSAFAGLPTTAFVNDIRADLFDQNTVYAMFDNHKNGDYKPYLFKSIDKGKTWISLVNNLPKKTLVWRMVQDHVNKDLIFIGTEFGVYFSHNGGQKWIPLKSGLPTIPVRDIAIHRRENDLVLGTFGRGIYILDDYTALRNAPTEAEKAEAILYTPRKGHWYMPKRNLGDDNKATQGDAYFIAANPPFGVEFTFYLKENYLTLTEKRAKKEEELLKNKKPVSVPTYEELDKEKNEIPPKVWLEITNQNGQVVVRLEAANAKGLNRIAWNLRSNYLGLVRLGNDGNQGPLVEPGVYKAQLFKQINGVISPISEVVNVDVERMKRGHLEGNSPKQTVAFWNELDETSGKADALSAQLRENMSRTDLMIKAYHRTEKKDEALLIELVALKNKLIDLETKFFGSPSRVEAGEKNETQTVYDYLGAAQTGTSFSTYGPTPSHRKYLANAQKMMSDFITISDEIKFKQIPTLETKLKSFGAPIMEGQKIDK